MMAVLTGAELAKARNRAQGQIGTIDYTKVQLNAAFQAIEDAMISDLIPAGAVGGTVQAYLSAVIDTATSPKVYSNANKKKIFAYWAERRFEGDR